MGRFDKSIRDRVGRALIALAEETASRRIDVKPLVGHSPWLRVRVGDVRVILRSIDGTYLVERVIDRRDLDRALDSLR
jgi:mRNA-degrading endonuclease RelE of RelBE toxin-antitoxin system